MGYDPTGSCTSGRKGDDSETLEWVPEGSRVHLRPGVDRVRDCGHCRERGVGPIGEVGRTLGVRGLPEGEHLHEEWTETRPRVGGERRTCGRVGHDPSTEVQQGRDCAVWRGRTCERSVIVCLSNFV